MESLKQNVELLQNALSAYENKKTKVTATSLRKVLMDVSKSCGTSRKQVLEEFKASVKPRVSKESVEQPKDEQPEFEVHQTDDGDLGDTEVVEVVDKPKRKRAPKKA